MAEASATKGEGFLKRFLRSLKAEWKKIAWPTKAQVVKQTGTVVAISLVLCAFIRLIDELAKYLIQWVTTIR